MKVNLQRKREKGKVAANCVEERKIEAQEKAAKNVWSGSAGNIPTLSCYVKNASDMYVLGKYI